MICATCGREFSPAARELIDCPKCWRKASPYRLSAKTYRTGSREDTPDPTAVYVMSKREQEEFDPVEFVETMKKAGFEFVSEVCPIKFAGRHKSVNQDDGTVLWLQWITRH